MFRGKNQLTDSFEQRVKRITRAQVTVGGICGNSTADNHRQISAKTPQRHFDLPCCQRPGTASTLPTLPIIISLYLRCFKDTATVPTCYRYRTCYLRDGKSISQCCVSGSASAYTAIGMLVGSLDSDYCGWFSDIDVRCCF